MEGVYVDKTDAKEIALYFAKAIGATVDKKFMIRSINNSKSLLSQGWSREQIEYTIDTLIDQGKNIYSLGYINSSIADVSKGMNAKSNKLAVQKAQQKAESEVDINEQNATTSNKGKLQRLDGKSNIGKKRNFDLPWQS